ncbi:hypothetical protein O988_08784 [Pseudogymnoascus sp. VKM F-3808]|nr:hypothetical protein O988_08784 [Pseudogymnoascus sp. VKM F-3808]
MPCPSVSTVPYSQPQTIVIAMCRAPPAVEQRGDLPTEPWLRSVPVSWLALWTTTPCQVCVAPSSTNTAVEPGKLRWQICRRTQKGRDYSSSVAHSDKWDYSSSVAHSDKWDFSNSVTHSRITGTDYNSDYRNSVTHSDNTVTELLTATIRITVTDSDNLVNITITVTELLMESTAITVTEFLTATISIIVTEFLTASTAIRATELLTEPISIIVTEFLTASTAITRLSGL